MPQKKKQDHIHKLQRYVHKSGGAIFFCIEDCNFKIAAPLALGKKTRCHRCDEVMQIDDYSIQLKKPHCHNCHTYRPRKKKVEKELETSVVTATTPIINPFEHKEADDEL